MKYKKKILAADAGLEADDNTLLYACLYILEIWNVKLYDYPELILIFYRLVTFKNLLNTLPSHDPG